MTMLVAGKYSIQIVFENQKQESLKSLIDKTPTNSLAPMMTHGGKENIFETKSFCWLLYHPGSSQELFGHEGF